ncbi:hypothetical protein [Burkholderia cepacia]|nr:hypothetical protein [Burkholderia cepacia]
MDTLHCQYKSQTTGRWITFAKFPHFREDLAFAELEEMPSDYETRVLITH